MIALPPGNDMSTCDMVAESSFTKKRLALFRVLGPSLPPLHSPMQTELNLRHILSNEKEIASSSECIHSFWVFNCMDNLKNKQNLESILSEFQQPFYTLPGCDSGMIIQNMVIKLSIFFFTFLCFLKQILLFGAATDRKVTIESVCTTCIMTHNLFIEIASQF